LILYRKARGLRVQRTQVPEPPYWAATSIAPYGARRGAPIAIDYLDLHASVVDRGEVTVCEDVADALERSPALHDPVLIEATGTAELVFRRGDDAFRYCCKVGDPAIHLISTEGALPASACDRAVVAIATWPLQMDRLEALFAEAAGRRFHWGAAVPVIFPLTTGLTALGRLAELAQQSGASFLASFPIDIDAAARKAIAQGLTGDRESYDMLFHADLEPLHTATERHIAALAAEIGVDDFIVPPRFEERSNWNAAVLLTLAATRMIAMKREVETASRIARSARIVAHLGKPLLRVAEAANLSIIDGLDEISADVLSEWLDCGRSAFVDHVSKQWRLRRDVGVTA
jgi:hypothetical protein